MTTEKFHYTADNGDKITLPWPQSVLTAGYLRKSRKLDEEERGWQMLEMAADEKNLAKIDKMGMTEFQDFMRAWQRGDQSQGQPSVGESEDSSTS